MKTKGNIVLILIAAISVMMGSCAKGNASGEDSNKNVAEATADDAEYDNGEERNYFVIRGVDMNSKVLSEGNFIWAGDLPYSDKPDSFYDGFTYPLTQTVVTWRKKALADLAAGVKTYIINGEEATDDAFDSLPADTIQRALIDGQTLRIDTRVNMSTPNPEIAYAGDEEGQAVRRLRELLLKKIEGSMTLEEIGDSMNIPMSFLENAYREMMQQASFD